MITFRYIYIVITSILLLTSCKSDKKETEIIYKTSDLSFFNLKGKVKTFAEIKIMLDQGNGNFNQYDKEFTVNYHEHFFLKNGKLKLVKNINPSPYLPIRLIQVHRTENSLSFKLHSKKEIYIKKIAKSGDKLICTSYDKLDDDYFRYHSEKYINKIFVKKGEVYLQQTEEVGKNEKNIYDHWDYITINNNRGYDSLVYLKGKNKDSLLLYVVKYLKYDKHGNWLKREFIDKQNLTGVFNQFSEYRKIEYYE